MESEFLCRICLENGATISIFENMEEDDSIFSKLCLCLNEEIKDIEGYPRKICNLCQITLNSVCNFIKKYKASCKQIEKSLLKVKQEIIEEHSSDGREYDSYDENIQPKVEIDTQYFIELLKPNNLTIKVKTEPEVKPNKKKLKEIVTKKKIDNKVRKNDKKKIVYYKNRPNAIATSILEGEYVWNGDLWRTIEEHESKKETKNGIRRPKPLENLPVIVRKKKQPQSRLCDLCGKTFADQEKLNRHKNTVHSERTKEKCPHCTKVFHTNFHLNQHIKRIHSEKKDFICSVCGKGFAFHKDVNSHYRVVHMNKKRQPRKYPCSICDKFFSNPKCVVIHERSAHTGERPAVCSVCNASFYHEDYLKEHMRLHTGATPYKCPICFRGYAQRGNMKSHIRHNHRLSDIDPAILSTIKPSYLKHFKQ